jgi:hypothetical protein
METKNINGRLSKEGYQEAVLRSFAVRERKNLLAYLPAMEKKLVELMVNMRDAIENMEGLDPRRFGAKIKYRQLCENTGLACQFFRAYRNKFLVEDHKVSAEDVYDALTGWCEELNKWTKMEKSGVLPIWREMAGKKFVFTKVQDQDLSRYTAYKSFSIDAVDAIVQQ